MWTGWDCLSVSGVWHTGVYRPGGHSQAGLWETSGLVGHGHHPIRIPGGLRAVLRRHTWRALWSGDHRWVWILRWILITLHHVPAHRSVKTTPELILAAAVLMSAKANTFFSSRNLFQSAPFFSQSFVIAYTEMWWRASVCVCLCRWYWVACGRRGAA